MFNNYKKTDSDKAGSPFGDAGTLDDWAAPAAGASAPQEGAAPAGEFFSSPETTAFAPVGATAPIAAAAPTRNVLGSDVSVVGILRFTDDLLVDGSVEGEITSDGVLTVGANASIQAGDSNKVAVRTKSAIIHGKVTGDIIVTDRVELAATAELVGDVTAARIAIQEGAVFIGHCRVGASSTPLPPSPVKKTGKTSSKHSDTNLLG